MEIRFIIPGEPKAKSRPRVTRAGIAYTPKDTALYENLVRMCYREQIKKLSGAALGAVVMEIDAYFAIPKSTSGKKRAAMMAGEIRPTKRPDFDNVGKIIADSLNGLAYRDDSQIVECVVRKWYCNQPRVEVVITEFRGQKPEIKDEMEGQLCL